MTRNKNGPASDDRGEMENNTPFAERDADAAVSGRVPADPELASVQRALSHMKEALVMEPRPEVVSDHAAQFAAAVPPAPEARPASPWRRRASLAAAVALVSGLGFAGTAAAADSAKPGDQLYGLDQALEHVGILGGGTKERLDEARELAGEGDVNGALQHASEALENDGQVEAAKGLLNAADAVAKNSSGDDVRARVSEMLRWMAGEDSRGAEFGKAVSERARELSGHANGNANEKANENAKNNANENANKNADKPVNENANENANKTPEESASGDGSGAQGEDAQANAEAPRAPEANGGVPGTSGENGSTGEANRP